mmetsp:Transcript_44824/g.70195  ORF Transcript_44824/g.70195 Transcript_44824/m.70195 type:complete len:108 (+) Transcript_44824:201-524(+)
MTKSIPSDKFTVLGFPCNQFGAQEPGSDAEIKSFAEGKGAKFPLFSKIEVNGAGAHPLYPLLKKSAGSEDIGWNFEKFLIINNSEVKNYGPRTSPKEIEPDIKAVIG